MICCDIGIELVHCQSNSCLQLRYQCQRCRKIWLQYLQILCILGHFIDNEPDNVTVRLNFEPAGRSSGRAGGYYCNPKTNICVVCGTDESSLRKYIVPHEYRKFFPDVMRDHQSHDVLLMCLGCHQKGNR